MKLTIAQAAERLGVSIRQVRYMIARDRLPAKKERGRWMIESEDLPLREGARQAQDRRRAQLQAAVEDALEIGETKKRRFSINDLRAFRVGAPIYSDVQAQLGADHPAAVALRRGLEHLARGCHRFSRVDKVHSYKLARDEASVAAFELAIVGRDDARPLLDRVEQDFLGALAGLLHRVDRRGARA